jgi:hypothetical protein
MAMWIRSTKPAPIVAARAPTDNDVRLLSQDQRADGNLLAHRFKRSGKITTLERGDQLWCIAPTPFQYGCRNKTAYIPSRK